MTSATAMLAMSLGAFFLICHLAHVDALKVFAAFRMKQNVSLAILLLGASLWHLRRPVDRFHRASALLAGAATLLGAATLFEYLSGTSLGIDEWLGTEAHLVLGRTFPGRMAPNTALGITLTGTALVLLSWPSSRRISKAAPVVLLLAMWLLFIALVGMLYDVESLYRIADFIRISPWSLLTLFALGVGALCARPEQLFIAQIVSSSAGGYMARRLMFAVTIVPLLMGWLRLKGQEAGLYDFELGTALHVASVVMLFAWLVWTSARALNRLDAERDALLARERQANEQLRESEAQLRRVVIQSPMPALLYTDDGEILQVSTALEELSGYPVSELRTLGDWIERASPERADRLAPYLAQLATLQQRQADGERVIRTREGGRLIWDFHTAPVGTLSDGRRVLISLGNDVTARHEAARALRASEQRFRTLVNVAPVGIYLNDEQGNCIFVSDSWCRLTGIASDEALGTRWSEVLHPEDRERVAAAWQESFREGRDYTTEFRFLRPDGRILWVRCDARPLRDETEKLVGYVGTVFDLTAQHEARESLEQTVRLRDEFVSVASHELRTPLTSLRLHLDNQRRQYRKTGTITPEKAQTIFDNLSRFSDRLNSLIEEMLDVSRIQSGQFGLSVEELDLSLLTKEVADRLAPLLADSGCQLTLNVAPDIRGSWDRSRLDQVLTNLLTNAARYAPGSPVEVELGGGDGGVRLVVRDHGPGIPAERQGRLFQRFERAGAKAHPSGGLGLGLFIVRQIVEAHGGRIRLESAPGQGSAFIVELPWQQEAERAA